MSLISEEQIGKILYFNMDNGFGCPSKQYENARYAIHQAIRETAEACAKMCEEVGCTRLAEFHDAPAMAEGCADEIRRRMGEGPNHD